MDKNIRIIFFYVLDVLMSLFVCICAFVQEKNIAEYVKAQNSLMVDGADFSPIANAIDDSIFYIEGLRFILCYGMGLVVFTVATIVYMIVCIVRANNIDKKEIILYIISTISISAVTLLACVLFYLNFDWAVYSVCVVIYTVILGLLVILPSSIKCFIIRRVVDR